MLLKGLGQKIIFKTNDEYLLQTQDLILNWCSELKRIPKHELYRTKKGIFPLQSDIPYAFVNTWSGVPVGKLMDWASTNCFLILIEEEEDLKKLDALIRLQVNSNYEYKRIEDLKKNILENVVVSIVKPEKK